MAAKITKEQAIAELAKREQSKKGWAGIGSDVLSSLESAPDALGSMVSSIPGGIKNVAKYATSNNPVETLGNMGAGAVEGGAALLSSPQVLMRYLAEKFPEFGKRMEASNQGLGGSGRSFKDPTFYEALKKFESDHGMAPQSEEEASVRNAGGLVFGGGALTKLPNAASRMSTLAAQQAGAGGDPVHAAILGMIGEATAKAPWKQAGEAAVNTAQAIPEAVMNLPENAASAVKQIPTMAAKAAGSTLEGVSQMKPTSLIPGATTLTGTLGAYLKYLAENPEDLAKKKLFSDIAPADVPLIQERADAAKRLGLEYMTPAELTLSPYEAAKQGTIGRTSEGSKLLFEKGKSRTASEASSINNLFDTIYTEKLSPEKKAAYDETMGKTVPDDFVEKWKQNPIVDWALKQMDTKPTYKSALADVPKDSFEYWNVVKRVIGDLEKSEAKGMQGFSSNAATKVRNKMVDEMDVLEPRYKTARNIAEREFTRKDLEGIFDKKAMTGNNFYKFLQSKKDFGNIMSKLEPFPEAQQQLKDMKLLFGDLIPNDMSIRSATALKRTGMSSSRNKLDALKESLDERYGKKHDVAAVNLMTNPDLGALISKHFQDKGK